MATSLRLVAGLVFAYSCCYGSNLKARDPADSLVEQPLIVRLTPSKTTIHPGEPIELRVEVWNAGPDTIFVGKNLEGPANGMSRLELYLEYGSHLDRPMSTGVADYVLGDKEPLANILAREWIALPPRHYYGQTVHMSSSDFPRLQKPGRYRVKGLYISEGFNSPRTDNPFHARAAEVERLPYKAWEGKTEANSVWITVRDQK